MVSSIKRFVSNLPLRTKIICTIIFVNLIFVCVVLGVDAYVVRKQNNELLYQTQAASLNGASIELTETIQQYETMSVSLVADSTIQDCLVALAADPTDIVARANAFTYVTARIQAYETQFSATTTDFISIHTEVSSFSTNDVQEAKVDADVLDALTTAAIAADGRAVWVVEGQRLLLARAIRKYDTLTLDQLGILIVGFELDTLIAQCTSFSQNFDESYFILLDDNANFVYLPENLSAELQAQIVAMDTEYCVLENDGHYFFAVTGAVSGQDWRYVSLVNYDSVQDAVNTTFLVYAFVVFLGLLLSILLSSFFMRKVTAHIDFLLLKMKTFGGADSKRLSSEYSYQQRKDEIGELHQHFDRMADEIEQYIEVDYTNKLLVKDAQLKALQAQIDPHFLYNVLASVTWRAKAIGEEDIAQMVESLSRLLRVTLDSSTDYFTLGKELALINSYIVIQKIRFAEQVQFENHIPEQFHNVIIPKLTLQPLVENAIKYAMEQSTDACIITLEASCTDNILSIVVSNTGSQFPEQFNEKLAREEIATNGLGIALYNIQKRLKLYFGETYGLCFSNVAQKATVTLTIPYQDFL